MGNTILLAMFVGSNRLYVLRRSFPESFRKITFFIFSLQMAATSRMLGVNITALQAHVEAISKVKMKNVIFLKLSGNDLLST